MMQEEKGDLPEQQQTQPWWFKWAQKTACVISGIICAVTGIVVCITLHPLCIVAGVFQVMIGALMVILEAPCCCAYLDFIDKITKFSENRPHWQKAVIYCVLPILPIALCHGVTNILGCIPVILCGLSFAYLSLGRKASREEMLQTARGEQSLVNNAAPMAQKDAEPKQKAGIV